MAEPGSASGCDLVTGRALRDPNYAPPVRNDRLLVSLAVIAGIALIVIAAVYWAEPAKSLPGFFPGHQAGSGHHHVKHGIAAFLVGLACFVFAWFRTGPKRPSTA